MFEKYQQLARDALTAGDRVLAESYQQHAEHYFRVLRAVQPQRSASDIIGRDAFASGYDIDFEDEGGGAETETVNDAGEAEAERNDGRGEWRQESRYENRDRQRDERPRDDRSNTDRNGGGDRSRERNFNATTVLANERNDRYRDDRPRDETVRDDRPREDRQNDGRQRESRQNDGRQNENRPRGDRPRYDRTERTSDPLAVVEPQASPLISEAEPASSPILRSQDGGVSAAPAFLQARPEAKPEAAIENGEARSKVRRRRAPRALETAPGEESAPTAAEDA